MERSENNMALLNDKEIMSLKDVEKLARIGGSTLSDVVRNMYKEKSYAPSETGKKLFTLV